MNREYAVYNREMDEIDEDLKQRVKAALAERNRVQDEAEATYRATVVAAREEAQKRKQATRHNFFDTRPWRR